jgi:hypothetical protein
MVRYSLLSVPDSYKSFIMSIIPAEGSLLALAVAACHTQCDERSSSGGGSSTTAASDEQCAILKKEHNTTAAQAAVTTAH